MPVKLSHKALAESHDLIVRLALGIEITATLASADRESRQTVLKYLLKPKELYDTEIDRGMKTEPSLIGTYSRVELYPESVIYLYLSIVIYPGYSEEYLSLGSHQPLEQCFLAILCLILFDNGTE